MVFLKLLQLRFFLQIYTGVGICLLWFNLFDCREAFAVQKNPKGYVQYYIKAYGLADPSSNFNVRRAYDIFDKVRSVADKRGYRLPQLKIINSPGDPWSFALPDGNIVVSAGAIEICCKSTDPKTADARIAFLMGHELAHLANNDFWYMEILMALSGDENQWSERLEKILTSGSGVPDAPSKIPLADMQKKELEADDMGFLYAAIAGYPVERLVESEDHFFSYWIQQTHTKTDITHPEPDERAYLLKLRINRIRNKLFLFQYGVRLAHFGRYEDAVYFFQEFLTIFPSREVFNNLGYCYLRIAMQKIGIHPVLKYWLPIRLDHTTRAASLSQRGQSKFKQLSKEIQGFINLSIDYFEKACKTDLLYTQAKINLAVTYLLADKIYQARAAVEEALTLEPDRLNIQGLKALIMYHESPDVDMWPHSIDTLKKIAKQKDAPLSIQYNLGVLLDERKRYGEAKTIWNQLEHKKEMIPEPFLSRICQRTGASCFPSSNHTVSQLPPPQWGIFPAVGTDLLKDSKSRSSLETWESVPFNWQGSLFSGHVFHTRDDKKSLLEINEYIEMVVLKSIPSNNRKTMKQQFGNPIFKEIAGDKEIWSYGKNWAIVFAGDLAQEVWIAHE